MIGEIIITIAILLSAVYLFYTNVIKGSASGKCSDCSTSEGCGQSCSSCSKCSENHDMLQKSKSSVH